MRSLIHTCLFVLLLGSSMQVIASRGHIEIESFMVSALGDNQYSIDAQISFKLSEKQQQALLHGVKLNTNIDIALGQHRSWWWNSLKLISRIRYQLSYHALSKHYILKHLDTDTHKSFSSLPAALKQMGKVTDYALPVLSDDIKDGKHYLYMAAKIDAESRSLPIKIQSYIINSKYYSESTGVIWALP